MTPSRIVHKERAQTRQRETNLRKETLYKNLQKSMDSRIGILKICSTECALKAKTRKEIPSKKM